jgi:hypothetical protein
MTDILQIGVPIPLDKFEICSYVNYHQSTLPEKERTKLNTRKEIRKRAIVLLTNTPQKHDCHRSPKQMNSWMTLLLEAYSPSPRARKKWNNILG